jgi:hypothetical protein
MPSPHVLCSGFFPGAAADVKSSSSTSRTSSIPDTSTVQDAGTDDPAIHDPQICFDFTKGMCTRGDKCKYSHDIATIVQFNSKEKGICFDYLRNQCHRGLLCRFSHDLSNIAQQCQVSAGRPLLYHAQSNLQNWLAAYISTLLHVSCNCAAWLCGAP